tara:strand:- start:19403 stop:19975 length:573 start_codon:yes stop_codon:yes gene_type:complete
MDINNIEFINIFTATTIVELICILFFRLTKSFFSVKAINDWYDNLRWSAVGLDILIVIIVFYFNIFLSKYLKINNYLNFLLLQLILQIFHDIIFYYIIKYSIEGNNIVMDEFKSYVKNTNIGAIVGDSWMYLMGIPILLHTLKFNKEILVLISLICLYIIGYLVYQKPLYKYNSFKLEYLIPLLLNINFL